MFIDFNLIYGIIDLHKTLEEFNHGIKNEISLLFGQSKNEKHS